MSYRPLTYFTALSLAAHAALFGLMGKTGESLPQPAESSIEIGLVSLPKIEKDFSSNHAQPQIHQPERLPSESETPAPARKLIPTELKTSPLISKPLHRSIRHETPGKTRRHMLKASQLIESVNTSLDQSGTAATTATEAAPLRANSPAPSYPAEALRYGWEGEVWLKVDVSRKGTVQKISIDRSSGYPLLDRAASKTVEQWQFEPARVGQEATEGSVRVPIRFRIKRS